MQDNPFDKQFMDGAWGQMQETLDREMPRNKRRGVAWWVFFPLVGILILIGAALLVDHLQPGWYRVEPVSINAPSFIPDTDRAQETWWAITPGEQGGYFSPNEAVPLMDTGANISEKEDNIKNTNSFLPFTQAKFSFQNKISTKKYVETMPPDEQQPALETGEEPIAFFPVKPLPKKSQQVDGAAVYPEIPAQMPRISYPIDPVASAKPQWWIVGEGRLFVNSPGDQYTGSAGFSIRKPLGRFSLEAGGQVFTGQGLLARENRGATSDFSQAEEMDTPDPGTNFVGNQVGNPPVFIRMRGASFPVGVNYSFTEKWGLHFGADLHYLFTLEARYPLERDTYTNLTNRQVSPAASAPPADLLPGLRSPLFIEPRLGVDWRFAPKWQLRGSFIPGRRDLLKTEPYSWKRDRVALQLRYRLGD